MLQVKMFSGDDWREAEKEMNDWIKDNAVDPVSMETSQSQSSTNAGYKEVTYTLTVWYEKD